MALIHTYLIWVMGFFIGEFMKTLNLILKIFLSLIVLFIVALIVWVGLYIFVTSVRDFTNTNIFNLAHVLTNLKAR